ncbi:hypothetical protein RDWZM_003502 [Blomia tropicalis]|uniref:Glutaredoxin-related protein 5, mitochondrial n=1 Tax=Blomia tropicalis TaxID=40697 RepID=A0A9Q0MID1_BLOTA|nr:Glutaredoxin- protein 5, mitochondrial [Blomia tropicalis]KAJ6224957.1 hypothetical protein RDWZM_003502 [Blomia tropicalis]
MSISTITRNILRRTITFSNNNTNLIWIRNGSTNIQQQSFDNDGLTKMVKSDKVVVFMKGVPEAPKCGFSNAVVQVLRMHGVPFQSHNVLDSEELRKAIKDFTSWPTIPQIFIDGEFIGGCDILLEKHQNGELIEDLMKVGIKSQILKDSETSSSDTSN